MRWRSIENTVHRPQKDTPSLIVEAHYNAGVRKILQVPTFLFFTSATQPTGNYARVIHPNTGWTVPSTQVVEGNMRLIVSLRYVSRSFKLRDESRRREEPNRPRLTAFKCGSHTLRRISVLIHIVSRNNINKLGWKNRNYESWQVGMDWEERKKTQNFAIFYGTKKRNCKSMVD